MESPFVFAVYLLPLLAVWAYVAGRRRINETRARSALAEAESTGLNQPPTLHPVIDEQFCIGCKACLRACPEGDILGLVDGRAKLVQPANCIGHGACAAACPMNAIDLVFGTAERGVDIPHVGQDFQTNVAGIYIAGELGGMGLIRNAIEQGKQAMDEIARQAGGSNDFDVVIVGAGPAGISASLTAKQHGLRAVTLEQEDFGGTVAHYPRGKVVMTAPVELPIYGKSNFRETTKEALLEFWRDVVAKTGLDIKYETRVDAVDQAPQGFRVRAGAETFETTCVLLAMGRRGTPRKLGVVGEDRSKVVYRLSDPEQYRGRNVLVVGGGDSALEAAASLAEMDGTGVTLSYRGDAFARAKPKNRARIESAHKAGRIEVHLGSDVTGIDEHEVKIAGTHGSLSLPNDVVIVCAGGILPVPFLKSIGIQVETKHGTA